MAEGTVPPLVLGEGSPKSARVPASAVRGHMLLMGEPQSRAAIASDVVTWAARLGAGVLAIDVDGRLTAVLADRASRGQLAGAELRVLTPSSTLGVPVAFKPMLGLSSAETSEAWTRAYGWLGALLATLAGAGPGSPDHARAKEFFDRLVDSAKHSGSTMLTVQSLVAAVRSELSASPDPLSREAADSLLESMGSLAEDLRNAALAYGAPVDLPRLLATPPRGACEDRDPPPPHVDVVLIDHMKSVADRNSTITALLVEVFAWCRTQGRKGRLLLVLPEVESPTSFIASRPFAQRLAKLVLESSASTGLLALVVPTTLDDPVHLPRSGGILLERSVMDRSKEGVEAVLAQQGVASAQWGRVGLLNPSEWTMAAGKDWSKWFRFTPNPEALRPVAVDAAMLSRLIPPEVRDVFKRRPPAEGEECAEDGEEGATAEGATEQDHVHARAAAAVEDAEEMLSYTAKTPAREAADARLRQEVKELLRRKLEEKERAKDAQRFELSEVDLVEGEVPSDEEVERAVAAPARRPVTGGLITDTRGRSGKSTVEPVDLHAEDLQRELEELRAKEGEGEGAPQGGEGLWVSLTPEEALLGVPPPEAPEDGAGEGAGGGRKPKKPTPDGEGEGKDIIIDLEGG